MWKKQIHDTQEINKLFQIHLNKVTINETGVFNFIGIVFNNNLTWKNHTSMISAEIAMNIYYSK